MAKHDPLDEASHFNAFCSLLKGSLPIHFQWMKNDMIIHDNDKHIQIITIGEKTSRLKIDKVKAEDTGNYTCSARNEHGIDSHMIQLIVKGKERILSRFS